MNWDTLFGIILCGGTVAILFYGLNGKYGEPVSRSKKIARWIGTFLVVVIIVAAAGWKPFG